MKPKFELIVAHPPCQPFAPRTFASYPPKPEGVTEYYHNYGYEVPVALGAWSWSTAFNRWGRIVTFADGWTGHTYPKPDAR